MNASRGSPADPTPTATIRMDPSIAPVSVITSQLQALSTFLPPQTWDVKVSVRIAESTRSRSHVPLYCFFFFFFWTFFGGESITQYRASRCNLQF